MLRRAAVLAIIFAFTVCSFASDLASGTNGIVASVNDVATRAGVDAMKRGGNAVDAAVATALTLGVVDGFNSGIGGGCFMLIRRSNGKILAIDGREMAPSAATRDMFVRKGKGDTELSQTGPLASGVPGALAAYDLALRKAGKLSLRDHLLQAAQIAEDGFRIDRGYASTLQHTSNELVRFDGSRAVFFKPDGTIYAKGDLFRQPDLANTYRQVATHGLKWFYGGPFAQATEAWMKRNGGILTVRDLSNYKAILREPISTTYRGYEVVSFPPPSSGGVHLLEMLNILETKNVKALGSETVDSLHLIAESMKLAFADRAYWLGDPDFAKVPRGLIAKDYAHKLAAKIDMQHAINVAGHSTPEDASENVFRKHTTHFSTADRDGNWVACTATVNTSFGSKVVIPGTGVVLNNEMDDFSVQPGVANFFGLVGNEANAVAPGKRPLSSMTPTIVLKDGQPMMSVGAAGGPTIISQTLLNIVNVLDFGMPLDKALAASRIHNQWSPDELRVEKSLSTIAVDGLEERGHKVKVVSGLGVSQAVMRATDGKTFVGAADPRAGGTARGW
ncbi:MAG: gamma-glutamyltransferase [Limisphaerales bacterium]